MTDKAYIVANEQQEREVLEKLGKEAVTWWFSLKPASQFIPSKYSPFPYGLKILGSYVVFASLDRLEGYEIVFDGRKEEHMSEKYVVSQVFMNELKDWKHDLILEDAFFVNQEAINNMPKIIKNWWVDDDVTIGESNKRLISIIRYMSGANDFEVEKPKKWVVRSKVISTEGSHLYVNVHSTLGIPDIMTLFRLKNATKFDTKEEAESWANAHQEVVQVEVDD